MSSPLDPHGQPDAKFNAQRRVDRAIHEFLGFAKGILSDGVVSQSEVIALQQWISANHDVAGIWPVSPLTMRIHRVLEDLRIDDAERADLADLLRKLVGGGYGVLAGDNAATALPLDDPPPPLSFAGQLYVFTGKFAFAPREVCELHVRQLGGDCASTITRKTNVVVIGSFGSRDWAHTSFGRKLQKAVDYRATGVPLVIVSEDHWAAHLPS